MMYITLYFVFHFTIYFKDISILIEVYLLHFFPPSILFLKCLFIYLAALGLCCCTWAFSSCGEQGLLFGAVHGLLIAVASLVAEHGLQARGLQQLQHTGSVVAACGPQSAQASVVVVCGLSSCGTWAQQWGLTGSRAQAQQLWCRCLVAPWHVGIFLDQGLNPCTLHWQAYS